MTLVFLLSIGPYLAPIFIVNPDLCKIKNKNSEYLEPTLEHRDTCHCSTIKSVQTKTDPKKQTMNNQIMIIHNELELKLLGH